jgi:hypothetical protein
LLWPFDTSINVQSKLLRNFVPDPKVKKQAMDVPAGNCAERQRMNRPD